MTKGLGYIGYFGTGFATYSDYRSYKTGDISAFRFGYRLTGTAAGLLSGSYIGGQIGGPGGALCGATIGGSFGVAELLYDGALWWINEMSIGISNYQRGIVKGWYPR